MSGITQVYLPYNPGGAGREKRGIWRVNMGAGHCKGRSLSRRLAYNSGDWQISFKSLFP